MLDPEPDLLGLIGCFADDVHGIKGRIDCEEGNSKTLTRKDHSQQQKARSWTTSEFLRKDGGNTLKISWEMAKEHG